MAHKYRRQRSNGDKQVVSLEMLEWLGIDMAILLELH